MPQILDGKKVRDEIIFDLKEKISHFSIVPNLAIIKIGDNPDSDIYVQNKINFAKKIGVNAYVVNFPSPRPDLKSAERSGLGDLITQEMLLAGIEKLNKDESVHGIIVQSPLPSHLNWAEAVEKVAPEKDVDGLCSVNVKKLLDGDMTGIVPATARGILTLLNYYKISVKGKNIVVMGRSNLVGKPVANLMINNGATVTVVHSQTVEPEKITREADILIVAIGKPEFVGVEFVKEGLPALPNCREQAGQVVIDVGINTVVNSDGTRKIYGDVDFDSVSPIVSAISPVPGGVGPMTVASLFQNLMQAFISQNHL